MHSSCQVCCLMEKRKYEGIGVHNGGSSSNAVWFRDRGTKEKTEGRAGGGTNEDMGEMEEDDFMR